MGWAKASVRGCEAAARSYDGSCSETWHALPQRVPKSAGAPLLQQVGGICHQAEMQRHHLQRGVLHILIGATYQVAQNDHAVAEIAGIERRIENAAIGHAAVQNHGADAHLTKQEIEVGG